MTLAKFILEGVERRGGKTHVIGRCGEIAIGVGDIFAGAYELARTGALDSDAFIAPRNVRPVSLQIERITAYQHALEQLSAGMTAELVLDGSGELLVRDVLFFKIDDVSERRRRKW